MDILARLSRPDFIIIYLALFILIVSLFVVIFIGSGSEWYQSLKQPDLNPWIPRSMWIIASIISYGAFFFLSENIKINPFPKDLVLSVLFVINNFIFLLWGATLYYAQNLTIPIWLSVILFIYNFWMFMYVLDIKPIAALFLVPNVLLYGYLVYSSIEFASLNNIVT